MQTEIQKMQLRQQQGMKEIFFHGGSVVVPVEEEKKYKEALADFEWDGSRVIVRDGKTHNILAAKCRRGMDIETARNLTKNEVIKIFAIDGRL